MDLSNFGINLFWMKTEVLISSYVKVHCEYHGMEWQTIFSAYQHQYKQWVKTLYQVIFALETSTITVEHGWKIKKSKLLLKHFSEKKQAKKTGFYGKICIKACLQVERAQVVCCSH